jgi:hypothetical protein
MAPRDSKRDSAALYLRPAERVQSATDGTADTAVPAENEIDCLDALATEMIARGWAAHITTPLGRPVRLFVRDPDDAMMCGYIVAAPDASGNWWYWFGWAERIAPAAMAGAAAHAITTTLRRPADPS